jgi:hypothetical protein
MIPAPDRKHLTTPAGLLFNELQKSPTTVISCVSNMLALALDLDVGRFVNRCLLLSPAAFLPWTTAASFGHQGPRLSGSVIS